MSIAKMFEAGRMAAREDQERSALAKHLQPALGGDKAAQQAIYGVAPMRGMEVEGLAQKRQEGASDAARKQLADLSTLATRAPQMAAQVYPQWKAALEATGLASGLPEQYEEGAMEAMRAFAQGGGDEQFTLAPGSARYGADGRLIVSQPFAPPKPDFQLYDGADGPVWLPKPGAGPMAAPSAAPPAGGLLDPVRDFGDLSGIPGVKTTSLFRDPERNARVGGVANSFHTKGQAGDFVVPQDQKAQFIQRARDMGYEALDEGDHVHVEPRRGARAASAFGPGQGISAIPVQGVRPKPKADGAPSGYQWGPDGRSLVPIPGGPADRKNNPTPEDQAKAEMGMRKEVTQLLKEPRTVISMFEKVRAAGSNPSAPNDLALIFAYMKMLDPGSVVREQEFANAQNAAGVPDQVRNAYNKALSGQRLNPDQRRAFVASAQQVADIARNEITKVTREYQGTAEQYGYDPRRAVGAPDFRNVQGGQPQPSAADPARQSLLDKYK